MNLDERLHRRLGIEASYTDQMGERRQVPQRTLEALRAALGPAGVDPRDAKAMLAALDRERAATRLEPVTVFMRGRKPMAVPLRRPRGAKALRWRLTEESGRGHDGELALDEGAKALVLPPNLPLGYHRLEVAWSAAGNPTDTATVIVVPRHAYLPDGLRGDGQAWGLAIQLYGLLSDRNWGIGDFGGLAAMVGHTAQVGGAAVGINPLHALFPDQPERCSPYSPSSRLFLNPLYLDVEAIEDFAECEPARALTSEPAWQAKRTDARAAPLVDYAAVAQLKLPVLELLFAHFQARHQTSGDAWGQAFRAYQAAGGEALRRFAVFHALRERHGPGWRAWPGPLRDPASPEVAAFAAAQLPRIEFHEYLQWHAERQLAGCAARASESGMGIGLYGDLAVGFDPDGADAWSMQALAAQGWSVGAPPDALALTGQSWGLPPLNPVRLRADRYRAMTAVLRANMRDRGALRIDHALGLQRLFWVPEGGSAADGAYVRYPFDDLIGLVALESVRNRCLVIGEDLGTVPPGFREAMQARGLLSYCVLYFERQADGGFRPPQHYPRNALATVSTHDLPTLAGFWSGRDIDLREQLALYPDPKLAAADRAQRPQERQRLTEALAAAGIDAETDRPPAEAVHRFLGRSAARLAMAQAEDLLNVADPANVPGTVAEHPNWRRKLPRAVDRIFADPDALRTLRALDEARRSRSPGSDTPRATYRLQMHRGFTFDQATAVLPYLRQLGISHLYLSPILEAQPGSTHGYDAVSYERINPELGGSEGFARFSRELRRLGLKLILDFVPNHMGIGGSGNAWWLKLLEWGADAPHASLFDIDWTPVWPELRGRLLVPFLGEPYGTVLERGELELRFDAASGSFDVWYHDHRFPIRPRDYAGIAAQAASPCSAELRQLLHQLGECDDPQQALSLKRELATLASSTAGVRDALEAAAASYRDQPAELHRLLDRQSYRLAWWRSAARRINYRRFFDINQLIGLRMDRRETFEACHRLIGELIARGELHGLRLDHIDGLRDPADYLRQLRQWIEQRGGRRGYIVVEKILAAHEPIPADWPIDGTTGYEFANLLNGVFVDPRGAATLRRAYAAFTGEPPAFDPVLETAKAEVIDRLFGAELTSLAQRLAAIAVRHWRSREYDADRLRAVLRDVLIGFPVYRSYVSRRGVSASDRHAVAWAIGRARKLAGDGDPAIYDFIERAALAELARDEPAYPAAEALDFAMRLQQLASPIMAKSLEDTAFYRYGPLLSLNEVGGDLRRFGVSVRAFHLQMRDRQRQWPRSLLATATHDTKRGEDMRARINLLSEMPAEWAGRVAHWARLNRRVEPAPHPADEYFIYQTLVGAWPMGAADLARFTERMQAYIVKALREAKRRSSWIAPDLAYERICAAFLSRLLATDRRNLFLEDFQSFQAAIARLGVLNSLSQLAVKLTVPGVPDTYQGTELWDLSLVDPDNRRPVDFAARQTLLAEFDATGPEAVSALLGRPEDGRIKLLVTARLLALRRAMPELFAQGSYRALTVSGPGARHVLAYLRRHGRQVLVVAVGRLFGGLRDNPRPWRQVRIGGLPRLQAPLRNALTGETILADNGGLELATVFQLLPVAVLTGEAR